MLTIDHLEKCFGSTVLFLVLLVGAFFVVKLIGH